MVGRLPNSSFCGQKLSVLVNAKCQNFMKTNHCFTSLSNRYVHAKKNAVRLNNSEKKTFISSNLVTSIQDHTACPIKKALQKFCTKWKWNHNSSSEKFAFNACVHRHVGQNFNQVKSFPAIFASGMGAPHHPQALVGGLIRKNFVDHYIRQFSSFSGLRKSLVASSLLKMDPSSSYNFVQRRHKKRLQAPKKSSGQDTTEQEDDTDTEDEESGDVDSDDEVSGPDQYLAEDREFSKSFKDLSVHLKSLRVDAVLSAGLNISRSKIEDIFLSSKLRLNGQKLLKKAAKMEPGDYADLIVNKEDGKVEVKRVRLISISGNKTKKDKVTAKLRAWRSGVTIEE